ncbi:MAG TPA: hypothetical protein VHD87_04250 [Acidimicrobiales bacterium]|nr:hypothetical protein [Acidimicrobiales bacterium]
MSRLRLIAAAVVMVTVLGACAGDSSPTAAPRSTSTSTSLPAGYLHVVFNDEQIVVEPAPDGVRARWTAAEALAAVEQNGFFREGRTRVWFGSYAGQPAWLAITDGLVVAPSLGQPTRGYRVAVFADGVSPPRILSGVAETGGDPVVDVAPPRRRYTGRLHVTFLTPTGGAVGDSLGKWMMEPATGIHPRLPLGEARRRAHTANAHVYFGLFTGLDDAGTNHTRAPAWMVFATGYTTRVDGGPCCQHTPITFKRPVPTFSVSVFSDDPEHPWSSGRLSAGGHPLVD